MSYRSMPSVSMIACVESRRNYGQKKRITLLRTAIAIKFLLTSRVKVHRRLRFQWSWVMDPRCPRKNMLANGRLGGTPTLQMFVVASQFGSHRHPGCHGSSLLHSEVLKSRTGNWFGLAGQYVKIIGIYS